MKRYMMLCTVAASLLLSACNNDNDHNNGVSNDPVLKETVRLTNQPIRNFENSEPEMITVSERGVDDSAEPIAVQF